MEKLHYFFLDIIFTCFGNWMHSTVLKDNILNYMKVCIYINFWITPQKDCTHLQFFLNIIIFIWQLWDTNCKKKVENIPALKSWVSLFQLSWAVSMFWGQRWQSALAITNKSIQPYVFVFHYTSSQYTYLNNYKHEWVISSSTIYRKIVKKQNDEKWSLADTLRWRATHVMAAATHHWQPSTHTCLTLLCTRARRNVPG